MRLSRADRDFVRFVERGDVRALGAVFDATAPELLRIATHLVGDPDRARDLVQSAFLVAMERRAQFAAERRVLPWLCGIVANLARNERRRAARAAAAPAPADTGDPRRAAEHAEFREAFGRAVAALPAVYRPVVELHLEHGLTAAEIGSALMRPAGTVRTQIVRGLELLRRQLPRGFVAAAVAVPLPQAGLRTARAAVLRRGAEIAGAGAPVALGGTAMTLIGASAMKSKLAVCSGLGAALVALGLWFSGGTPLGVPPAPPVADPPAATMTGESAAQGPSAMATRAELARRAPTDEGADAGTLTVVAHWASDGQPAAHQIIDVVYPDNGQQELAPLRAQTDAAGRCAFDELAPGAVIVHAGTGEHEAARIDAGRAAEVELALRGYAVNGRVVGPHGAPVADAAVWISSEVRYGRTARGHLRGHGQYGAVTLRADADGRFATRMAPSQCVAAFRQGYGPSGTVYPRFGPNPGPDPVEVVVRLAAAGGAAMVRVMGAAGRPLEGALVVVGEEVPHFVDSMDVATPPALRRVTGADGLATLSPLPTGSQDVQIRAPHHAPWRGKVEIPPAGEARLDVVLSAAATVTGVVRDDRGAAVEGALVYHGDTAKLAGARCSTRTDGGFSLEHLPIGQVEVVAWHETLGIAKATLTLNGGETTEWNPTLSRRPAITGIVWTENGKPAAGAYVTCYAAAASIASATTTAGEDGRFALGPLDAAGRYQVTAQIRAASGGNIEIRRADVAPESDIELRARPDMAPTARLRGRVVYEDRRPAGDLALMIRPLDGTPGLLTAPAADGSFELGPWKPCRVRISVTRSGSMRSLADLGVHEMRAHETVDVGELVVTPPGSATLRVTGAGERASRGVLNLFVETDLVDSRRFADEPLVWDELPPGRYTACARVGGARPAAGVATFDVQSNGHAECVVALRDARRCTVHIATPDGSPRGMLLLTAVDADGVELLRDTVSAPASADEEETVLLPEAAVEVRLRGGADEHAAAPVTPSTTVLHLRLAR